MAVKRGNTYVTRMRVPPRYRGIDSRVEVWIALRTNSQKEAKRREPQARAAQLAKWEAELTGLITCDQARAILTDLGLPARTATRSLRSKRWLRSQHASPS
jgi:hypothetical protein